MSDNIISFLNKYLYIIAFLIIATINSDAQTPDNILITGNYKNVNLIQFLNEIEFKDSITFYYKPQWFTKFTIDQNFVNIPVKDAIYDILKNTPYTFEIVDNSIVFITRADVAVIMGQFRNHTNSPDEGFLIIGNSNQQVINGIVELNGRVTDGKNGNPIPGVKISIENTGTIVLTNKSGNYTISLTPGIYGIDATGMGYDESVSKIKLLGNGTLNFDLFDKSVKLNEVTITASIADKNIRRNQMSIVELDAKSIKQLPVSSFGEKDIIRSLTMQPGIKSVGEFGSGLNVRGGSSDQNLFLLQNTPIFNTGHVFGLVSVVNSDAIDNVTVYKGDIPASYGERASSVVKIQMKEDIYNKFHGMAGIGLLDSRLTLQIPVKNDNASLLIGGRTSYSNWLLTMLPDVNLKNSSAKFYDLNSLLTLKFSNKNKITIFGYNSNDYFRYNQIQAYKYDNLLGSINWYHIFNSNLFSALTFCTSKYDMSKDDISNIYYKQTISTGVWYNSAKMNFSYSNTTTHSIEFGFQAIHYQINPGEQKPDDSIAAVSIPEKRLEKEQSVETAIYFSDKYDINDNLSITAGIRFSNYFYLGPKTVYKYKSNSTRLPSSSYDSTAFKNDRIINFYNGLEPRISIKYLTSKSSSVKFSYNRNKQYISLVSYTSVPTPDDLWKLSDTYIKPLTTDQFILGYFQNFLKNTIEMSVEVYYKNQLNLIEYKNFAQLVMNDKIETSLINANGKNYGIELQIKKYTGSIDGWISYTYSRALKKTDGIFEEDKVNSNNYYASSYDIPHNLTLMATYHYNKRLRLSGTFNFASGRSITLPKGKYLQNGNWLPYYSGRNEDRLPDYHRLDLSVSYDESIKLKKKWKGSWTFSIINVYGRKNAYSVFYQKTEIANGYDYSTSGLFKLYIIGQPLPTLTYNIVF